jgi:hypothetical protein
MKRWVFGAIVFAIATSGVFVCRGRGRYVTGIVRDHDGALPFSVVLDGGSGSLDFRTPWGGTETLYHSIHDGRLYWGDDFAPTNGSPLECRSPLARDILRVLMKDTPKHERDRRVVQYWIDLLRREMDEANEESHAIGAGAPQHER